MGGGFGADEIDHGRDQGLGGSQLPTEEMVDSVGAHDLPDTELPLGNIYDIPFPERLQLVRGLGARPIREVMRATDEDVARHPAARNRL